MNKWLLHRVLLQITSDFGIQYSVDINFKAKKPKFKIIGIAILWNGNKKNRWSQRTASQEYCTDYNQLFVSTGNIVFSTYYHNEGFNYHTITPENKSRYHQRLRIEYNWLLFSKNYNKTQNICLLPSNDCVKGINWSWNNLRKNSRNTFFR